MNSPDLCLVQNGIMRSGFPQLSAAVCRELLRTLEARFTANMHRHLSVTWDTVPARLEANPALLWSLHEMERTGGEPDVVCLDGSAGDLLFIDCCTESPAGRRSVCYDQEALISRKHNRPAHSAVALADAMGAQILDEQQYRQLQALGKFDTRTSSWVQTPPSIRKLGGALFCDRRYETVFVYHNGADSYYASRAFRVALRV